MEDDLMLFRPDAWFRAARGPRYEQLYRHLSAAIAAGELPPEAQLPPERELALIADVSRVTVRKAVSQLVEDGVLEQRRGAGTFVRPARSKIEQSLSALLSFTDYMRQRGKTSSSRILRRGLFLPTPDETMSLGLSAGESNGCALPTIRLWRWNGLPCPRTCCRTRRRWKPRFTTFCGPRGKRRRGRCSGSRRST
jgi:GntR family transcriptional regulator